ncbi:hypothetical protein EAI_12374 [Harpegnathos saltator]|uniref:Uncharacterized protein n=1 Tax=Harpegnathos saltator TaxID=610380 RepID=E2BBH6_HARSA|nr:hypothetical protein EAI_12374 [Harpegnathos saltator]
MNVRRLPGFMYNYKLATVLLLSSLFLVIYLLLHWGIMCTNLEAWRHVSTVRCANYSNPNPYDSNPNNSKISNREDSNTNQIPSVCAHQLHNRPSGPICLNP